MGNLQGHNSIQSTGQGNQEDMTEKRACARFSDYNLPCGTKRSPARFSKDVD